MTNVQRQLITLPALPRASCGRCMFSPFTTKSWASGMVWYGKIASALWCGLVFSLPSVGSQVFKYVSPYSAAASSACVNLPSLTAVAVSVRAIVWLLLPLYVSNFSPICLARSATEVPS